MSLKPFSAASGTTIGDLEIETDDESLVLSGSIEFRRDLESLRLLDSLIETLQAAADAIRSSDVPESDPRQAPATAPAPDPFAD